MTEKLKQIAEEEIMKLPKEAQDAINSLDWGNIAEEIGKEHLLSEGEVSVFQAETLLVLVGIEYSDLYTSNIENNVGTTREEAEKMARDAYQKIFIPVNDAIMENIKKNLENKNPSWEQTVDFVLSGGNYAVFMEDKENLDAGKTVSSPTLDNSHRIEDIKSKFVI